MRRTINGKRYDTTTSKELGTRKSQWNPFCSRTLYKTNNGAYFGTEVDQRNDVLELLIMTRQEAFEFAQELGFEGVIDEEFHDLIEYA